MSASTAAPAPFAVGSVSFRLYPHNDRPAPDVVGELCAQGRLALRSGFAGVMTSEHHGGFPGYLPNPLQTAGFVLEEDSSGWAAPCPLLLTLRPPALVAEEVAWLAARHPGRVGLGVAAGALPADFEVMDLAPERAVPEFASRLPRVVALLRGEELGPLAGDPALTACADHPVPVLSAAVSPAAARRVAACGAGILLEGMSPVDRLARIVAAFREAGGTGAVVLIRRVWLGEPPREHIERQRAVYEGFAPVATRMGDDRTVVATDAAGVVEELAAVAASCGAESLNLRVHLPGIAPGAVREQVERLGAEVVDPLARRLRDATAGGSRSR